MAGKLKSTGKKRPSTSDSKAERAYVPTDAEIRNELGKTKWGQTYLTEFLENAHRNTQITYLRRQGYFEMLESLAGLFKDASYNVKCSELSSMAIALLLGRTQGNFFAAVRLSSSGQLSEAYAQLRVCIEHSLYGLHISSNPDLVNVWFDRHESEAKRKVCKNKFMVIELFKTLDSQKVSLGNEVKELYESCIDLGAHPNERSVMPNVQISTDETSLQLLNTEPGIFEGCLAVCIKVGTGVLQVFELIYPTEFKSINSQIRLDNIKRQFQMIAPAVVHDLRVK